MKLLNPVSGKIMSLLSEGIEYGEEPRPFEDHHVNQWRYLPQFCGPHFAPLVVLYKVKGFGNFANPRRLPCDVDGCFLGAEWNERSAPKVNLGGV